MPTLADNEIRSRISAGELIIGAEDSRIGPACYELRMGSIYYDLTESDRPIDASRDGTILIKPGHRVVLITQEELRIPANILARVISKGSLFSIGLSPVCTCADPGFSGRIGIVTQNLSDKYLELPIGEPIAKVDFSLLLTEASAPYRGQHGFHTQIWPIKNQFQKSYRDISTDRRVESEDKESLKVLPGTTATIIRKLQEQQRRINLAILGAVVVNMLVLAYVTANPSEVIIAVLVNLISSAIVAIYASASKFKE